ncbi:MAG: hypothetical protein HYX63_06215 [Gammaproteobacteria bacterium]|nr:hypothetical protein [Gammaproteobacteria bacterium]
MVNPGTSGRERLFKVLVQVGLARRGVGMVPAWLIFIHAGTSIQVEGDFHTQFDCCHRGSGSAPIFVMSLDRSRVVT